MEILLCVREVPDDTIEIHLDPSTGLPDLSRASAQANAFDSYGLEMAVRYIEEKGGNVTLLSIDARDTTVTLKNLYAVGAAKGYMVSDEALAQADSLAVAKLIKAAIAKIEAETGTPFDLVMLGKETTDYIGGEMGGILAEVMGLPLISNIVEFEEIENGIKAKKELDSGYYMVETSAPAVVTVSTPNYEPRYPTIKSKMAARKMTVTSIPLAELGIEVPEPKVQYVTFLEPPKRSAGIKLADLEPEEAVAKIMEKLAEDKVI